MTIVSTAVLISLAIFLISNIQWFKVQSIASSAWSDDVFQIHIHHLLLSMIKRSVGLFSGFAALFIGTAVCFYSLKKQSQIDLKSAGLSIAIATSSPGIIAMMLGAYLIITTVESKDHFAPYPQAEQIKNELVKPKSKFPKTEG